MALQNNYQHWQWEFDTHQIMWLSINLKNHSVNTINRELLEEFRDILSEIDQESDLTGLVIRSGKSTGFIVGADIKKFSEIEDEEEAADLILSGHEIFKQLASLKIPTLALIHGNCLGGGLELALACDYRLAEESLKTRLGLPEVKIGIHPGWGGTVRLPRLIGALHAMDLILTGRSVTGRSAKKIGLVDDAVPERQLQHAAQKFILQKPPLRQPSLLARFTNTALARPMLAKIFTKKLNQKIRKAHYPAPYKAIENWVRYGVNRPEAMFEEAKSCTKLFQNKTARNLVRVFFLQDRLKNLSKQSDFEATHVHVVGAGVMGGDIAAWCALHGMRVTLQDREAKLIAPAIARAHQLFKKKLKQSTLVQDAMDRLIADVNGEGNKPCSKRLKPRQSPMPSLQPTHPVFL